MAVVNINEGGGIGNTPFGGTNTAPTSPTTTTTPTQPDYSGPQKYNTTLVPDAGVLAMGQAAATQAYQQALAKLNLQRSQTLNQAGYTATFDPNSGAYSNLSIDPHNPYGQVEQLFNTHALNLQNAQNAMEDRGIRGGLAHQADTSAENQAHAETSNFASGLMNTLTGYEGAQGDAATQYQNSLYQAELAAIQAAIAGGNFNPTDYGNINPPGYGDSTPDPYPTVPTGGTNTKTTNVSKGPKAPASMGGTVIAVKPGQTQAAAEAAALAQAQAKSAAAAKAKVAAQVANAYNTNKNKKG